MKQTIRASLGLAAKQMSLEDQSHDANTQRSLEHIPPYGFPIHLKRDGEPEMELLLDYDEDTQNSPPVELVEKHDKWLEWRITQPDDALFVWEARLMHLWRFNKGTIQPNDLAYFYEDLGDEIQKLRDAGHGDLIQQYWPHWEKQFPSRPIISLEP